MGTLATTQATFKMKCRGRGQIKEKLSASFGRTYTKETEF